MHCGRNAGLCQSAQWGLLLAPVVVVWQDGVFSKDAGRAHIPNGSARKR
jgi:hypothetical protein